ncbi:MAG TPA: hypothetical protein DCK93_20620, partial [Blastocatellia bacterium]|nr:hypothetical protein [Blastocatellia bacterium]HAF25278.1 hypothetical protein [Blastocatellia bacterium]
QIKADRSKNPPDEVFFGTVRGIKIGVRREEGRLETSPVVLICWLPTVDTLRNFFLRPTAEILAVLQTAREGIY